MLRAAQRPAVRSWTGLDTAGHPGRGAGLGDGGPIRQTLRRSGSHPLSDRAYRPEEGTMFKRTLRCLVVALASGALVATPTAPAHAQTTLTCQYTFFAWSSGFSANLTIINNGPTLSDWTARWSVPVPTTLGAVWLADMSRSDPLHLVATNLSFNATIPTGRATTFGWTAAATSATRPTDITVNGIPC
jgi:hypothetical protein